MHAKLHTFTGIHPPKNQTTHNSNAKSHTRTQRRHKIPRYKLRIRSTRGRRSRIQYCHDGIPRKPYRPLLCRTTDDTYLSTRRQLRCTGIQRGRQWACHLHGKRQNLCTRHHRQRLFRRILTLERQRESGRMAQTRTRARNHRH